jgi:hypothetical protein
MATVCDVGSLVGCQITAAEQTSDGHLRLALSDGRRIVVEGVGYDGLWSEVIVFLDTGPSEREPLRG